MIADRMVTYSDATKVFTDEEGWQHFGARFVNREEWAENIPGDLTDRLSADAVARALAAAADDDGLITDFDMVKFFERDVAPVIGEDLEGDGEGDAGSSPSYDLFTAMVLHDLLMEFAVRGLLARRHGGDYRLALPESDKLLSE